MDYWYFIQKFVASRFLPRLLTIYDGSTVFERSFHLASVVSVVSVVSVGSVMSVVSVATAAESDKVERPCYY